MIPTQPFGQTGHVSTRILFGGAALYSVTQEEADATLDVLFRYGINHIDTAASYGQAELRIGPWMDHHRDKFFLATKTEERTRQKGFESLQRSLEMLHTDHVDLFQLHNLSTESEWEIAMGPGGVLEACIEARQKGLIRFIGVTGHGTDIARLHKLALERFDFDSVLLPYNFMMMQNPKYAADVEALFKLCRERNVAIQTIKSLACGEWGDHPRRRATWYRPVEDQADIDLAVRWVLAEPGVFLNSAADIHLLPRVLDAAQRYQSRPLPEEMQALVDRTKMQPLFR
jgi:aryl-alcohol dehydrogenase-like predicted oxidoreductase